VLSTLCPTRRSSDLDGDVDVIDFRYHLVSIIAVFLALTVGLVLGTTMLQDPLLNTLKSETADLRGTSEDLRAERDVADSVNTGADEMRSEERRVGKECRDRRAT